METSLLRLLPSKPAATAATSNNNNQIMINYIALRKKNPSLCFAPCLCASSELFRVRRFLFCSPLSANEIKLVSVLCKIVLQFSFFRLFFCFSAKQTTDRPQQHCSRLNDACFGSKARGLCCNTVRKQISRIIVRLRFNHNSLCDDGV